MQWKPDLGSEIDGVLAHAPLDAGARAKTARSAWRILGKGIDPTSKSGSEAGLVVGYVQSGKTLSFTTVIGLARDNRFPIVIVIAGTKTSLLSQSAERLVRDLDAGGREGRSEWRPLTNPGADNVQTIRKAIEDWADSDLDDDERSTLLMTVLKQHDRLAALTAALSDIDLSGIPVLVIDDEADQAGLNAKVRKGEESTVYMRLRELRDALPLHTYLLYTATPQAPLLININSALSPSFVEVLEPGSDYVGGAEFFAVGSPYAHVIPSTEILDEKNLPTDPPKSLIDALRIFFVGLAATLASDGPKQRRSMMVHPSRITNVHRTLKRWVEDCIADWRLVEKDPDDPDYQEFVKDCKLAWTDLLGSMPSIPPFDAVMSKMRRALRRTHIIEFNTRGRFRTPEIEWRDADGWILIGGQALDRGYTVDSLTVTYMPRGLGTGNADALQQRARFFGYKRSYLGLCRVYLESASLQAFRRYVEHEEIMRAELKRVANSNISLREWTRQFVLSPALRPCRTSVISVGEEYVRTRGAGGWTQQREAKLTDDLRASNAEIFGHLIEELDFEWDATYQPRSAAQRHKVAHKVPLRRVAEFLADYKLPDPRDTAALTALYVTIGQALEDDSDATSEVYVMRPDYQGEGRGVDKSGFLTRGFLQGRTGDGRDAYPGDSFFSARDKITLQLHQYDLYEGPRANPTVVARGAPLIAVHTPQVMALPTVVQSPARPAAG
jgi:hypothetical protein